MRGAALFEGPFSIAGTLIVSRGALLSCLLTPPRDFRLPLEMPFSCVIVR
jgi:hypothetical protein